MLEKLLIVMLFVLAVALLSKLFYSLLRPRRLRRSFQERDDSSNYAKVVLGDSTVGILVQDLWVDRERRTFYFSRVIGPSPVVGAFFRQCSDATKTPVCPPFVIEDDAGTYRLQLNRPLITTLGRLSACQDMIIAESIRGTYLDAVELPMDGEQSGDLSSSRLGPVPES